MLDEQAHHTFDPGQIPVEALDIPGLEREESGYRAPLLNRSPPES
jgi:hypothetical protein